MIDLHCHILPGVDDGADTLADSIAMAEKAISQGITHILCTPHHNNGKYVNPKAAVIDKVTELQAELDRRNLPLTLLEGQEVRITGDLVEEIQQDQILFTDLADTYLLIEFPTMDVLAYTEQLFSSCEIWERCQSSSIRKEMRSFVKIPIALFHTWRWGASRNSPLQAT